LPTNIIGMAYLAAARQGGITTVAIDNANDISSRYRVLAGPQAAQPACFSPARDSVET
jgi:hypothetical protein